MTEPDLGNEFARETGELTARRWKIGLSLYLLFALAGEIVEWQTYPARGVLLLFTYLAQVVVVAVSWFALRGTIVHPKSAWIALGCTVSVPMILAVYNIAVRGDMLYVLLTYLAVMLVSSVFIPWGAQFQLGLNSGVIVAYVLALVGGARVGPVPPYDYTAIAAATVFSTLGALYVDRYRRRLFGQASALRDANRELQHVNQSRTELLSGLSHDMRTPVSVVMGYAEILSESEALAEELRHPVRSIMREARELLHLVDGVLDLARIESGQLPFHRSTFRLSEVLAPLRETAEDLMRERSLRLRWDIPTELVLDGDAGKVREIVRNLLSNAVKFTPGGEISLVVAPARDGVEIVVADTGVGIAAEHIELIFDPFRQIEASTGQRPAGSGFGLYMVKLLVTLLGGRVTVQSALHTGSSFRVWLPPQPPATA